MVVIETVVFTKQVQDLLSEDEYRVLQTELVKMPDSGVIIPKSGGIRKVRWPLKGKGKRGGLRTIYYWATEQDQLFMLLIYPKNIQDDLTPTQLKQLRKRVENQYNG